MTTRYRYPAPHPRRALVALALALAGVTVGIGLIMAHPETTPQETRQAGNVGAVVFVVFPLVAAFGVFGGVMR